jgi:hypothetical protein
MTEALHVMEAAKDRTSRRRGGFMKAVVYQGPRPVRVKEVPDARIERPTDVPVNRLGFTGRIRQHPAMAEAGA